MNTYRAKTRYLTTNVVSTVWAVASILSLPVLFYLYLTYAPEGIFIQKEKVVEVPSVRGIREVCEYATWREDDADDLLARCFYADYKALDESKYSAKDVAGNSIKEQMFLNRKEAVKVLKRGNDYFIVTCQATINGSPLAYEGSSVFIKNIVVVDKAVFKANRLSMDKYSMDSIRNGDVLQIYDGRGHKAFRTLIGKLKAAGIPLRERAYVRYCHYRYLIVTEAFSEQPKSLPFH